MKKEQLLTLTVAGLVIYLVITGVTYLSLNLISKKTSGASVSPVGTAKTPQGHFVIDPAIPRTEACPLNGKMYTKQEMDSWSKRRPILAMIENHVEARPQSGISNADVVYEAVAEGGITRFLAAFYCEISSVENPVIAPVRSARMYFIRFAQEYGDKPIYMHVGGANDFGNDGGTNPNAKALEYLESIGWRVPGGNDFDTTYDLGAPVYIRDTERLQDILGHLPATEHTMVGYLNKAIATAAKRGFTNVDAKGIAWDKTFEKWKFKDEAKDADRGAFTSLSFVAWKGYDAQYGVRWDYDKTTNVYKRFNAGVPHLDLENKEQLTAKNIVVEFAKEIDTQDAHLHLLYNNVGAGDGLLFQDGKVTKVTWTKQLASSRTKYFDANGREISFNRGQIWIEMLPIGTPVNY